MANTYMTNRKINIAHAIIAAAFVVIGASFIQPPLNASQTADMARIDLAGLERTEH